MTIRKCDKCGCEVPIPNEITQMVEHYEIYKVTRIGRVTIDLCKECQKQLESWLKGEQE